MTEEVAKGVKVEVAARVVAGTAEETRGAVTGPVATEEAAREEAMRAAVASGGGAEPAQEAPLADVWSSRADDALEPQSEP